MDIVMDIDIDHQSWISRVGNTCLGSSLNALDLHIYQIYIHGMNKTEAIFLRMSEEEKVLFTGAANLMGLPLAAWARMVMREAAQRQAERQGLDDQEPTA
jgi:hypothetical protein